MGTPSARSSSLSRSNWRSNASDGSPAIALHHLAQLMLGQVAPRAEQRDEQVQQPLRFPAAVMSPPGLQAIRRGVGGGGNPRRGAGSMEACPIVDRYAPSPTSDLHLGNLRTALAGWLLARRRRPVADARRGPRQGPGAGRRRRRGAPARRPAVPRPGLGRQRWCASPSAWTCTATPWRRCPTYECFCTRREIAEAASAPHDGYRPYPGTCRRLTAAERAERGRTVRRDPGGRARRELHRPTTCTPAPVTGDGRRLRPGAQRRPVRLQPRGGGRRRRHGDHPHHPRRRPAELRAPGRPG